MPGRDIVTIGGSAGSFQVLEEIVSAIPPDLEACIVVIVHLWRQHKSVLPELLNRKSAVTVQWAAHGERLKPGRIYVAPQDRHLLFADDHIHLTRGPKEGLQRPSINVTFRSAAASFGPRVVGVLLSGMLDDGAAGLWEIAHRGGTTIVQDPREARYPSMPLSAAEDGIVNYQLKASDIGPLIARIVSGEEEAPLRAADGEGDVNYDPILFTCPECHGPLSEIRKPGPIEFRCRVGHVLPLQTLIEAASSTQERKLYEAMLALLEGADLAEFAVNHASDADSEALRREAAQLRAQAETVRRLIEDRIMPEPD